MFSLNKFYDILHNNLVSEFVNGRSYYFYPFGTYDNFKVLNGKDDIDYNQNETDFETFKYRPLITGERTHFHCYFFDQEPLYDFEYPILTDMYNLENNKVSPRRIHVFAVSEKSELVETVRKKYNLYRWYYFFHGFAALDWYRDFQYVNPSSFDSFSKVFICYNHLMSKYRSYRLHLVSNLISQDLVKHGAVSLFLEDSNGTWKQSLQDPESPLDTRAKIKIYQTLRNVTDPLVIDTKTPNGSLSAEINFTDLTNAFWHIVTETVYFLPKLHLTEKVFKPIIAQRPFILVAAPGNLAYLKSYGFKTFDRWIDESYDQEQDHYIRIERITSEIAKLCALPMSELKQMHQEMQEVLQYNYNHFYGNFKHIIVNELVDNFEGVLMQFNNGRQPNNHSRYHQRFELSKDYLQEVKQRLLK
jgi:hypothetical protein